MDNDAKKMPELSASSGASSAWVMPAAVAAPSAFESDRPMLPAEAAEWLKLAPAGKSSPAKRLMRMAGRGVIGYTKVCGETRFTLEHLRQFLARNELPALERLPRQRRRPPPPSHNRGRGPGGHFLQEPGIVRGAPRDSGGLCNYKLTLPRKDKGKS